VKGPDATVKAVHVYNVPIQPPYIPKEHLDKKGRNSFKGMRNL
jgi:hypothetical protein